ncbi:MAG: HAMP domain-containing sensor histidine kinase [Mariniblastus sp.]|nr:HAMP domain-containing sensor histidine kinase [Mariniblastus sp.]
MFERRSLKLPITLGVAMIIVILALIIGWVLLSVNSRYWALLTVGTLLFILMLVGVVMYLTLTIKAINLTRRQSNFIDSVTHELKSPIASLKLYLQTMNLRQLSEEERKQFQKFMMEDVERLDGLISHLLDAGNIESRRRNREFDSIELGELIRGCGDSVCARYRVIPETIKYDLKPCQILAQRVDAVMIFRNLIDNAVKYAGSPPQVNVMLRMAGENAVVEISDNGEGIPKGLRQKVFGRFVRLGEELQRKKPGTGLGLYIVRTLVKRLGGNVRVLDRDRRRGTVFEVRIPLATSTSEELQTQTVDPKPAELNDSTENNN